MCVCVCICHFFHQGAIFFHSLAPPLTSCVSLDMSLNLSEPQFPPLENEDDSAVSCICYEGHNPMLLSSGRTFLAAERCTKWDVIGGEHQETRKNFGSIHGILATEDPSLFPRFHQSHNPVSTQQPEWYFIIKNKIVVVQSPSHIQLFCSLIDCSLPGSSVRGIFQARILESVAISFSRGSSQPRDGNCVSCIGRQILYWAIREAK